MKNSSLGLFLVLFAPQAFGGGLRLDGASDTYRIPQHSDALCVEKVESFFRARNEKLRSMRETIQKYHDRNGLDAEIMEWVHAFRHRIETRAPKLSALIKQSAKHAPYEPNDQDSIKDKIVAELRSPGNAAVLSELFGDTKTVGLTYMERVSVDNERERLYPADLRLRRGLWTASDFEFVVGKTGDLYVKFRTRLEKDFSPSFKLNITQGRMEIGGTTALGPTERGAALDTKLYARTKYDFLASDEKELIGASPLLKSCLEGIPQWELINYVSLNERELLGIDAEAKATSSIESAATPGLVDEAKENAHVGGQPEF